MNEPDLCDECDRELRWRVPPPGADPRDSPEDVCTIGRFQLVRWLRKQPATLDAATIAGVFGAARKSTTWQIPK
jgi:hypothetical protein